jgi:hypothetical protein
VIIPVRHLPASLIWRSSRAQSHEALTEFFRARGSLYGAGYDELEAANIRELCEELGIPMGYGRVGKTPSQLHGYEGRRASGPRESWSYWDPDDIDD